MKLSAVLALLALPTLPAPSLAAAPQSGIAIRAGAAGQPGALFLVDESTSAVSAGPAKLDGITFLPLEVNGRTGLGELMPGAVRVLADVPGATRVLLPDSNGHLYLYRRALSSGALRFGFLHATPAGSLRILLERPGVGPQGADDPFHARIAVARDGGALLAATKLAAGGDLLEVELASGALRERTTLAPPLVIDARSLTLAAGFGLAVSSRGLLRFATAPNAQVQHVFLGGPSPDPRYFGGELVLSQNGAFAATAAGEDAQHAHVWVVGAGGPARRATHAPAAITSAGFLPESNYGPYFTVSDDGGRAAWRQVMPNPLEPGVLTREAFVRAVDAPASTEALQISADAFFTDTLDEVGVLTMAGALATIVAVGALETGNPQDGIESADFFRITLDANGDPQFENLTRTSGDTQAPFLAPGEIEIDAVHALPGTTRLLVYDGNFQGAEAVLSVETTQHSLTTLVPNTRELDFFARAGDWLVLAVERDTPARPRELYRIPADLSGAPQLVATGFDREYLHPLTRDDGQLAWLTRLDVGPELIQRADLATGVVQDFPFGFAQYGELLGLSPRGALVLTRELGANGVRFVVWPFGTASFSELPIQLAAGHLVPGA